MKLFNRLSISVGLLVLTLIAVTVVSLAMPVVAQEGPDLPTPTVFPAENTPYTLEVVGGKDETFTFSYAEQETFKPGETTVTSEYPMGMRFTVTPSSTNGDITEVTLFIVLVHGIQTRFPAEWDPDNNQWVALPWDTGGQPPWTTFDFYWYIRDASGAYIETPMNHMDYFDPYNEWFRSESDLLVLFWRDFGEEDPDTIAQKMADTMASIQPRKVAGFGIELSYKPSAVIFPDQEAFAGMYGSGINNTRVAGFTSSDLGMSVQVLRHAGYAPTQEECIWSTKPEDWTMERRINTIYSVTTHEVTHLYQFDVQGDAYGYLWWSEGQAEYFSTAPGKYDERLRHLATLQDLPSLQGDVPASTNEADGCYALAYDVGASFINWLLVNYGGLELHRQISEELHFGTSIFESIEKLTGKPFLEIENEWRVYLGYKPLTAGDLDPSLALEPYEDPLIAVGDKITLPALPAMVPLGEDPLPRTLAAGTCFSNPEVEVLKMGQSEGVAYFQINCMGMIGWVTRDKLVGAEQ
ncbi:MAG: hypothetical protein HY866_19175 [Chloroflexi bacterium]|nr:hypothetical protein [Chloroflexota bacterium]